ncbi:hypothetical protein PEL8287_02983 [Roseovarius litorisediminis]|uniref:Uncharacterized protein n=1 Tax=Roseovarius litorisediminis TaxID=1312363 RepID=A0A1Y5T4I4_9RHOB|nr:hypothetical protein [Roseovarius litorisediminis]SLN55786.1 hypothetical protein PEL8287_02983 [Roseovarius litorisediminis]
MDKQESKKKTGKEPQSREDRLKAALKANLSRRKSQLRAREGVKTAKEKG